ncbi:MAG: 3-phosphoshikimate 1-carboxyvinyltransferase [Patescibacteria group bacterium]|nr:3-phosphoshikimate 1-carboxyvinyltransferase [Patescibacteria group bacterium]
MLIKVPSSKSYTNRALILAALRKGKTVIKNPLDCDDTKYMIRALKKLGITVEQKNSSQITITSNGTPFKNPGTINIGNAGTAMRFLTPLLALQPFTSTITGNLRMQERPMKDLIIGLEGVGFRIEHKNYCPPLKIHGDPTIKPKKITVKGSTSSQYISALLLSSPLLGNPEIKITDNLVSKPYIKMTRDIIKNFDSMYTVETDASSASYFFALGALGFNVKVANLTSKSLQADIQILKYLKKMGCKVKEDSQGIQVIGPKQLKPLGTVDLKELPDSAMTLSILCCFAKGRSTLKGLSNLRFKECDRLAALQIELSKTGARVKELNDGLQIYGIEKIKPSTIATYDDHRMAMCAALLKSQEPKTKIQNPGCVSKTYPNFWNDFETSLKSQVPSTK